MNLNNPQPQTPIEAQGRTARDLEFLHALGYVDGTHAEHPEQTGVIHIDPSRVFPGPRLYSSVMTEEAHLIDVEGRTLHTWTHPSQDPWSFVRLLDGGDLLVIERDRNLLRLGPDSTLRWSLPIRPHHDLDVWNDTIVVLTREEAARNDINRHHTTAIDFVSFIGLDGELQSKISLFDLIASSDYAFLLRSVNDVRDDTSETEQHRPLCLLHANHVEVIDSTEPWQFGAKNNPQILVSMRNINTFLTFDISSREITWIWGPNNLVYPHHPSLLSTGKILLFDNGIERSEVLEIDPENLDIVWRYTDEEFFTKTRGSAQRLPNGNTLITESNQGRVIEVTADGEVVWEFKNPDIDDNGMRGAIFRMTALEQTPKWLQ
jgi:hypothetical protein